MFNYSGRIPGSGSYHQALTEWILAYHERTGNPNDRIVSFDAYQVDDDSPPIGEPKPRNVRSHVFLSYPPSASVAAGSISPLAPRSGERVRERGLSGGLPSPRPSPASGRGR